MTTTVSGTSFESLNPRTGDVVGHHPVNTAEEVRAAVDRAHEEAAWWGGLSFDEREKHLQTWKGAMTRRLAQLAEVMHLETGKPHGDAMLESALAIDHLAWAASHAEKVLKRRKVPSGLLMANQAAYVEYQPLGVIGVIGPWNYPVFTPMGSIGYALAAGNAVVFKPSEYTPGVGEWLARTFLESVGRPVLQVVTGFGETGHALCTSGADKIAFTGSTATGKKVMAACAETLTPVVIEAGGKDALLVDSDADIEAAADAAIWGACSNAGQTCTGVERVYVHERVYDEFLSTLTAKARGVTAHEGSDSKIGPITMPKQLEVIKRHIDDALARGGRAVVGGADAVGERFVQPTVLVDVPEDSAGGAGGDVRPHRHGRQGQGHGRGDRAHQRHSLRARLDGVLEGARHGARLPDPLRHDRGQRRDHLRGRPLLALRRRRRLRLRPDPRPGRPQGVHLRQGDRPAAVQAAARPHDVRPHREGRPAARLDDHDAARPRDHDPQALTPHTLTRPY